MAKSIVKRFLRRVLFLALCLFVYPHTANIAQANTQFTSYRWSDDGLILAVSTISETLLYHAEETEPLVIPVAEAKLFEFRQDKTLLASVDKHDIVNLWDTKSGALRGTWGYPDVRNVTGLYFAPHDDLLAINFADLQALVTCSPLGSAVWLWAYNTDDEARKIPTVEFNEYRLILNDDGSLVFTIQYHQSGNGYPSSGALIIRDTTTGEVVQHFRAGDHPIRQIGLSPADPHLLAAVDDKGRIGFWSTTTGEQRFSLNIPDNLITEFAFSPDGTQFATGGTDSAVRIWDTTNGELVTTYPHQPAKVQMLRFNESGDLLVFGDPSEMARYGMQAPLM